ncbi:MAG: hypothetical protein HRU15_05525 [Planctomycetes bacterium]|nr:hypothetical protein [Planctomycetota bacterium]
MRMNPYVFTIFVLCACSACNVQRSTSEHVDKKTQPVMATAQSNAEEDELIKAAAENIIELKRKQQQVQKNQKQQKLQEINEAAFTASLKNAQLKGFFTMRGKHQQDGLAQDTYTIYSVEKVAKDFWKMEVGIRYATTDVRVPLFVPIKWAGDTPVVSISDMMIPGIGTYSARVLFNGKHYAGTWDGDGYGGELFGQIMPMPAESKSLNKPK